MLLVSWDFYLKIVKTIIDGTKMCTAKCQGLNDEQCLQEFPCRGYQASPWYDRLPYLAYDVKISAVGTYLYTLSDVLDKRRQCGVHRIIVRVK